MFNWTFSFINDTKNVWADWGLIFAFGNLIVGTALDIAFHGIMRIRLSGARNTVSRSPADVRIDGESSIDMDKIQGFINNF